MLWLDSNYPPDADPSKPGVGLACHDVFTVSVIRNVIAKEIFIMRETPFFIVLSKVIAR